MPYTCSGSSLITNGACYTRQTLNPNQQKALQLYAKALLLANSGGTNYTTAIATTLLTDATQFVCGITQDQIVAGKVALWMDAAGVTSTSLTAKLDAVKCLANADPEVLEKADLLLTCKLLQALIL